MEQKAKNVSPFSNERRNAYVVEHLTSSMLELLKEKPINEISISELCFPILKQTESFTPC